MSNTPIIAVDEVVAKAGAVYFDCNGQLHVLDRPSTCGLLLPGSFNPIHDGHWGLAQVAAEMCGEPVAFELSVANVDKPSLDADEIRRRIAQFQDRSAVWLTYAPRFLDKATLFPGATFVVGADTALRLVSPRYHDGDEARLHNALAAIVERGCRFLVACRVDQRGQCLRLADVPVPRAFERLFEEIPPERFRCDLSSTQLRA